MAEIEDLLKIRNEILSASCGNSLFNFLHDYITENACMKNLDSAEVKGMCRIVQAIKDIPKVIENKRKG